MRKTIVTITVTALILSILGTGLAVLFIDTTKDIPTVSTTVSAE